METPTQDPVILVQVKSFHIKVSWFSSEDFGPKTPLLFFFFSIYDTKQKEFHIRTMLLCESLLHQDQRVSKAYAYQGFFLLTLFWVGVFFALDNCV